MTFPLQRRYSANVAAVATTASALTIVDSAHEAETVSSVIYIPTAAATGAATHNRTMTLFKRGVGGTGTVPVATLSMVSGTDLADNVPKPLILSTASGALSLSADEVLEWSSVAVGNGIADPGGRVQVNTVRTVS